MSRSRAIWLGLVLALGIAAWLVGDLTAPVEDAASSSEIGADQRDVTLIEGPAAEAVAILARADVSHPELDGQHRTRGPVTVRVVDPWGRPFADRWVEAGRLLGTAQMIETDARTDAQGRADFDDLPYDGSRSVGVLLDPARGADCAMSVRGPHVMLVVDALPLRVHAEPSDGGPLLRGVRYRLDPRLESVAAFTGDVREHYVAVGPGKEAILDVKLDTPHGYVSWDARQAKVAISPTAKSLTYLAPLRPEADVFATLPRARRDWQFLVSVQGRTVPGLDTGADAFGRTRLRGIPFVSGAHLTVFAKGEGSIALAKARLGRDERDAVALALHEPKPRKQRIVRDAFEAAAQELKPQSSGRFFYNDGDPPSPRENFFLGPRPRRVEIRVQDPDGQPAVGARVVLGWQAGIADARGRVAFLGVPNQEQDVVVTGAGPSWRTPLTIALALRQTHHVRVPHPGTIDLQVIGEHGPIPHAGVRVEQGTKLPWYDVEDGEQRLDAFVDARGRRRLRNVQPDTQITVSAYAAGQTLQATTRLAPGEVKPLTIDFTPKPTPPVFVISLGAEGGVKPALRPKKKDDGEEARPK